MRATLVILTFILAQHHIKADPPQNDYSNSALRLVNPGMYEIQPISNNERRSIQPDQPLLRSQEVLTAGGSQSEYQPQQGHVGSSQSYQSGYMPNDGYMQLPREYQNRPEATFDDSHPNSENSDVRSDQETGDAKQEAIHAQQGYAHQQMQQDTSQNEYSRPMSASSYMRGQPEIPDGYQMVNESPNYGIVPVTDRLQGAYQPQQTPQGGSNSYQIFNDDSSYKVTSIPRSYSSGYQPQGSYNMNNAIQKQNYIQSPDQDGYQIPQKYQEILDKSALEPVTITLPGNNYRYSGYNSQPHTNAEGYQVVHEDPRTHMVSLGSRPDSGYYYPNSGQQRGASGATEIQATPLSRKEQDFLSELGLQLGYPTSNRNSEYSGTGSQQQYAYPQGQRKPYESSYMSQRS